MEYSANLTAGYRWELFCLLLACLVVYVLGMLACGVGLVVAVPVIVTAIALAYRFLQARQAAARRDRGPAAAAGCGRAAIESLAGGGRRRPDRRGGADRSHPPAAVRGVHLPQADGSAVSHVRDDESGVPCGPRPLGAECRVAPGRTDSGGGPRRVDAVGGGRGLDAASPSQRLCADASRRRCSSPAPRCRGCSGSAVDRQIETGSVGRPADRLRGDGRRNRRCRANSSRGADRAPLPSPAATASPEADFWRAASNTLMHCAPIAVILLLTAGLAATASAQPPAAVAAACGGAGARRGPAHLLGSAPALLRRLRAKRHRGHDDALPHGRPGPLPAQRHPRRIRPSTDRARRTRGEERGRGRRRRPRSRGGRPEGH